MCTGDGDEERDEAERKVDDDRRPRHDDGPAHPAPILRLFVWRHGRAMLAMACNRDGNTQGEDKAGERQTEGMTLT